MGNVVRARQRALTALLPHQHNKRVAVPKRFGDIFIIPTQVIYTATTITLNFPQVVSGGSELGFTVEHSGVPTVVVASQAGTNDIILTHAAQTPGEIVSVVYALLAGAWVSTAPRIKVGNFSLLGVVP